MSLSKPIPLCKFCEAEKGKYCCPSCNIRYCSGKCYKDPAHERCTEMFFQKWCMSTLREQSAEEAEKQKMLEILKRNLDDEDDDEESVKDECIITEDLPIEDRFHDLDLENDVNEKLIWDRLNQKEKEDFKKILEDENELGKIVPIKQPWWITKVINLVLDNSDEASSDCSTARRPPLPIDIKSISSITSKCSANTIRYDVVNVLYAYVFLVKFHNNDLKEFIEEIVDSLLYLCPVFLSQKNYSSLEESIQDSIQLLTSSHFQVSMTHAKSFCSDICSIIDGPSNAQPNSYVLCALNDLKMLLAQFRMLSRAENTAFPKNMRKTLQQAIKKLEYYLSWTVAYYETDLKHVSSEIQMKYFPEILNDLADDKPLGVSPLSMKKSQSKKVLIEELS